MPSASDSKLAIILLIASSPETESLDQQRDRMQGGTPGHVTLESSKLFDVRVPANHFLLSTHRSKPTTASQPQQPWNILTWISTETQVATAECTCTRSLLINNTWAYLLFGASLIDPSLPHRL
ncbi:hypothetical protein PROFUN_09682 [Planoprotostelium fungivorum]|uniref:Uncharacterized protein n=1 Tax=Planoprotostelium fungivorum TaxID=1890364 RepID=A0A2P6NGJ2_9EUKA|nr:hypothetical protein PROFUN_09682 [Planoprotostelium fungivorum]